MPTEYFRGAERGVDGDGVLERDLAVDEALPVGAASCNGAPSIVSTARNKKAALVGGFLSGGARRDRTADLLHAMQALSQLSYGPDSLAGEPHVSSSFSMVSPMMSVTSGSPSSSSSMNAASSVPGSISTSSISPAAPAAGFLPCCSASASSSETNSASAVSGTTASGSATGAGAGRATGAAGSGRERDCGGTTIGTTLPV